MSLSIHTGRYPSIPLINWVKKSTIRAAMAFVVALAIGVVGLSETTQAGAPVGSPFFGESLRRTRITISVEDQTLQRVLEQLLRSVNLGVPGRIGGSADDSNRSWSLWLDRRIDPNQRITLTTAGTPASKIILDVVESVGLVVYPLPGVLLVGRPEWVEQVLAGLPEESASTAKANQSEEAITIEWPTGTPAVGVLGLILTASKEKASKFTPSLVSDHSLGWMPHDVWHAGQLISVQRSLAAALVLSQFDLQFERVNDFDVLLASTNTSLQTKSTLPASPGAATKRSSPGAATKLSLPSGIERLDAKFRTKEFLQAYPLGDSAKIIRESLKNRKPRASIRVSGDRLLVRTVASNHLDAIAKLWRIPMLNQPLGNVNGPAPVFDLKLVNKPVSAVLKQLAGAAGKKIRFAPGTELLGEQLVSLDAVKQTLKQLAMEVAGKVNLQVDWGATEIVVSKP